MVEIYGDRKIRSPIDEGIVLEWKLTRAVQEANEMVLTCCSRGLDELLEKAITSRTNTIRALVETRDLVGPWGETTGIGAMSCVGCKS